MTIISIINEEDHDISQLYTRFMKRFGIKPENMSGRRVVATHQDFWIKLGFANTAAVLVYTTDATIEENIADRNYKHKQRTNENRLITELSGNCIQWKNTVNGRKNQ